jgi:DNA/RNA-binding domain of Phe-tRNA-synthetase-like protein
MGFINPTLDWYKSISAKNNLPLRCPLADIYKCPKYCDSLYLLEGKGGKK